MKKIFTFFAILIISVFFLAGSAEAQNVFLEGFETGNTNGTAIAGWTQEAVSGTGVWLSNNSLTTYNRSPQTGAWNAAIAYSNTRWMFKSVTLTSGVTYKLSFYARQDGAVSTNASIRASYGTTGTAAGMTNAIIANTGIINGGYQYFQGTFTPATSGTFYIGILGTINGTPWYISIDDISLDVVGSTLTGTKTIGSTGDYISFTSAINALNTQGVGAGGVTFDVAAGETFTENIPIITATGTSANPIVFQKSVGLGNPVIKPTGGISTLDAGIRIEGGDYITFDGIDITINTGSAVEYGYYLYNASATNGAQNNTIKNTKITLNRANTSSRGIFQNVLTTPTNTTGANSNNKFQSVIIENSYQGIYITGNATYPDLATEISNCTIGAASANDIGNGSTTLNGIRITSNSGVNVFNNEVRNVTTTGAVALYGIYLESIQGTNNVYNNKVHDLRTTSTSTSSIIYGIRTDINSSMTCNIYNNFVYELYHGIAAANATQVIRGIALGVSGTGTGNVYYNSVRIGEDAMPTSTALYLGTGGTYNIINNIFTNFSTAGATSFRHCIFKASGSTLNTVNNNNYYLNTAGTNNFVGSFNGTNYNTLANWQAITGKDGSSKSVDPAFTSATDLHIPNGTVSELESAGTPIGSVTTDIDGQTRNATTPDIGADEFAGVGLDLTPPSISYTALTNTSSTSARVLTTTITDLSGVPTSGAGLPMLYWRINSGSYAGVQGVHVSGSTYSFTFGGGVVAGDNVYYYVVAQDNASTPNVSANPSGGAGGFTANPPAAGTPPTTPNTYLIIAAPLSGNYTVGAGTFNKITGKNIYFEKVITKVMKQVPVYEEETKDKPFENKIIGYKDIEVEEVTWIPMENGKKYTGELYVKKSEHPEYSYPMGVNGIYTTLTTAVNDFNTRGVSGATNFILETTGNYTTGETFPISINVHPEYPTTAVNTLTIKPGSGVTAAITGTSTSSILKINGADYVTIDGSNSGGTDRSLTVENTSTASSTASIWLSSLGVGSGANNNTIKNCIVKSATSGTNTTNAIFIGGATIGSAGSDNDNNTIQNNSIIKAYYGINVFGVTGSTTDNINISGNTIGATLGTTADYITKYGIYTTYVTGLNISQNTVQNIVSTNLTLTGMYIYTGCTSALVERNNINNITYTGTGGYGGWGIYYNSGSTTSNSTFKNNFVSQIGGDGWTTYGASSMVGMYFDGSTGGLNIYNNSVFLSGTFTRASATLTSAIVFGGTAMTGIDLQNNTFVNSMDNTSVTTDKNYAIHSYSQASAFTYINNNNYFANGSQGVLGNINVSGTQTDQTTLSAWATATGKDAGSVSGDPKYLSNSNLHIDPNVTSVVNGAGTNIASVTNDYDGDARQNPPDIGADEYTYIPPSVEDPTGLTATNIHSTQIDLNWTNNGNNNNVMLVVNTVNTFATPVDGNTYTVGGSVEGVGTVVYIGLDGFTNHTGLAYSTTYYYKAYSVDPSNFYSPGTTVTKATTLPAVPASFTATPFSSSQINLTWTKNAASNDIIVATNSTSTFGNPVNGTTYNANDPITGGGTVIYRGSATGFNHTGLTEATTYYYKIWSVDAGVGYSSTGLTGNAATVCGPQALPYAQSFDGATFVPTCWASTNAGSGNAWTRSTSTPYAGAGTMFYGYNGTYAANAWAFTPGFNFENGKLYRISFYQKVASATYPEKLKVTIGTAQTVAAQTTTIWDNAGGTNLTNTTYILRSADFNCTSNGIYYFAFNVYSDADMYNLFVDEVSVIEVPPNPIFSIAPTSKAFGNATVGGGTVDQIFTITNTGAGTLTINSGDFSLTGTDANQFQLLGVTNLNLTSGQSGTVRVQFAPTSPGNKSANLTINDNISDAVNNIPLTGTGILNAPQSLVGGLNASTFLPALTWQAPAPANEIKVDDGTVEQNMWVGSPSTTNQYFYNKLVSPHNGTISQIGLYTYASSAGNQFNSVMLCPDDGTGKPNLSSPYASFSNVAVGTSYAWVFLTLTTPQAVSAGDVFYIVAQWPAGSTTGPFIGTDNTLSNGRSYWTQDGGTIWNAWTGNFFMRAYMGTYSDALVSGLAPSESKNLHVSTTIENKKTEGTINIEKNIKPLSVPSALIYGTNGLRVLSNYNVRRGDATGVYNQTFNAGTSLTYDDNSAAMGSTYYYVVEAVYTEGTSGYSNEVVVTALNPNYGDFFFGSGAGRYRFSNSTSNGNPGPNQKPTFEWWPTSTFTPITFSSNDDASTEISFPGLYFRFFNNNYSSVFVGTNGYITFGLGSSDYTPGGALPQATDPFNMIAAAFRDLYVRTDYTPATKISYLLLSDKIIISYENIYHISASSGQNYISFQIVLYLSSVAPASNSLYVINYNDLMSAAPLSSNTIVTTASVGTNGPAGLDGYNYRYAGTKGPMFGGVGDGPNQLALGFVDFDSPLPVKLSSFSSQMKNRDVTLNWVTENEVNNAGFEIERKTFGSSEWKKVAYVEGKGNTSSPTSYKFEDKKLNSGKYNYRLKQIDFNGGFEYHNLANFVEVELPTKYDLSQNYPNPFNPVTKIDYSLPFDSKVQVEIYDMTGRLVKNLLNENKSAGYYTIQYDASGVSSGTYFYRIIARAQGQEFIKTLKMVVVK